MGKNNVKLTPDFIISNLEKFGFFYLSGEITRSNNINLIDKNGYKYFTSYGDIWENIGRNVNCAPINISNPFTMENMEIWIRLNKKSYKLIGGEYLGAGSHTLQLECLKCGESWESSFENMNSGCGCPYCAGKRVSINKSFGFLFPYIAEEWDNDKNTLTAFEVTPYSNIKRHWICRQCGGKWMTKTTSRTYMKTGCPICGMSGYAKEIFDILSEKNFLFEREYSFEDLVSEYGNKLRYDFAILNNDDVRMLIEYDDLQHEKFIPHFHRTEEEFFRQCKNDDIKDDYAKSHNIFLLRIKYKDRKNIEQILTQELLIPLRKEV